MENRIAVIAIIVENPESVEILQRGASRRPDKHTGKRDHIEEGGEKMTENAKETIEALLRSTGREGIENLLAYMEKSGFYTAFALFARKSMRTVPIWQKSVQRSASRADSSLGRRPSPFGAMTAARFAEKCL